MPATRGVVVRSVVQQRKLHTQAAGSTGPWRCGHAEIEIHFVNLLHGAAGIAQCQLLYISGDEKDVATAAYLGDPGGVAGDRDVEHHAGDHLDPGARRGESSQRQSGVDQLVSRALFLVLHRLAQLRKI
ncbi:MAG: hypothetical protein ACLP00_15580, partial [Terracidiphilus sp.]